MLAVAERATAQDVESCLEQLRAELIPWIIAAIEPDQAHQQMVYDARVKDIVGEWEARLEKAYAAFGAEYGQRGTADDIQFRYRYVFRLRNESERELLRRRLNDSMDYALIEAEPGLRQRLPSRRRSGPSSGRARGFEAAAADHRCVVEVVEKFGADWVNHLEEICQALQGAEAAFPKKWSKKGYHNWAEVADCIEYEPEMRKNVRDYIRYRVEWIGKKKQASEKDHSPT